MLKYTNKLFIAVTLIASILNSFVFLIEPLITSKIFDVNSLNSSGDTWDFLLYGLTLYLLLYTIMLVANLLINHIMTIGCGNLRLKLYQRLLLDHRDMANNQKISMLTQDVEYYLWNYISPSILLVGQISDILLLSLYLLSKNLLIGFLFIVCSLMFLGAQHLISKRAEQKGSEQAGARQKLLALLTDFLAGNETLVQNQALLPSLKQVQRQSENYEETRKNFEIFRSFFGFIADLMLFVSQFLPIFFAFGLTLFDVEIATTDLVAMFIAANRLEGPLMGIVDLIFRRKGASSIAKNFDTILEQAVPDNQLAAGSSKNIEALDVSQLSKSFAGRNLFSNLSFRFENGKKYLIKGPSGSGKSTLFKLILQEILPENGSIDAVLGDGQLTKDYLQQIGLIAQSPYLFNDSIRYNLTLGEDFSDALLLEKLEQVGLTNEIADILDYQIVNNGENISGGQKVRLEIARNLLRQKKVLLADEVTAPLDAQNARNIRNLLFGLPVTVIEVAHHIDDDFVYDGVLDLSAANR